eukprot:3514899-Rhodomonas_salina.3
MAQGPGLAPSGPGLQTSRAEVQGPGSRVQGPGSKFQSQSPKSRVQGPRPRVQVQGSRVHGAGCLCIEDGSAARGWRGCALDLRAGAAGADSAATSTQGGADGAETPRPRLVQSMSRWSVAVDASSVLCLLSSLDLARHQTVRLLSGVGSESEREGCARRECAVGAERGGEPRAAYEARGPAQGRPNPQLHTNSNSI